ncbi:hypothetical protein PHYSODRAFT_305022 [Phytophthora sojae]|uniref:Uncharacterized protein n=1 Tax=Phytophthora sojae (strain P6497) TaxID=1094619 RepID=G5A454_PHYSP|nr:hypothetical protein PHYSODRAFT_305022 [Phytophthora sojae]EGZ09500.1 hypothetical protein PHYSODRAFT_305022 [Phytophthora sojae]|eukprot:XP_009534361.1 hypothetical protein PHYSODRAFT_305022 [Phytophthora sojae]
MNRRSRLGKFVALVLVAAVELIDEETDPSPIEAFASAACTAERVLVEADNKVATEPFMDDMRLGMLSRVDVLATGKIVKLLKQLRDIYPSTTRVGDFKAILQEMVADLDVWMSKRCIGKPKFDQKLALIHELIGYRFEMWDPRGEPMLGEAISKLERVRSLQRGSEWDDLFSFNLQADVTSPPSTIVTKSGSQKRFDNAASVEKDFGYVTTYEEEVRCISASSEKMKAFDELVDLVQWLFNTIRWTADSSLLPIDRLCQLNGCFETLTKLCDNGKSLNMEGCIHLEKLLCSIRQVMYMRRDYAACSKCSNSFLCVYMIPITLLGLFPPEICPEFTYPEVSLNRKRVTKLPDARR